MSTIGAGVGVDAAVGGAVVGVSAIGVVTIGFIAEEGVSIVEAATGSAMASGGVSEATTSGIELIGGGSRMTIVSTVGCSAGVDEALGAGSAGGVGSVIVTTGSAVADAVSVTVGAAAVGTGSVMTTGSVVDAESAIVIGYTGSVVSVDPGFDVKSVVTTESTTGTGSETAPM